jgi:hypothetical protein
MKASPTSRSFLLSLAAIWSLGWVVADSAGRIGAQFYRPATWSSVLLVVVISPRLGRGRLLPHLSPGCWPLIFFVPPRITLSLRRSTAHLCRPVVGLVISTLAPGQDQARPPTARGANAAQCAQPRDGLTISWTVLQAIVTQVSGRWPPVVILLRKSTSFPKQSAPALILTIMSMP